jgi:hypothetical protein
VLEVEHVLLRQGEERVVQLTGRAPTVGAGRGPRVVGLDAEFRRLRVDEASWRQAV